MAVRIERSECECEHLSQTPDAFNLYLVIKFRYAWTSENEYNFYIFSARNVNSKKPSATSWRLPSLAILYVELIRLHSSESSIFSTNFWNLWNFVFIVWQSDSWTQTLTERIFLQVITMAAFQVCIHVTSIDPTYNPVFISTVSNFIGNNVKLFAIAMEMNASIRINC